MRWYLSWSGWSIETSNSIYKTVTSVYRFTAKYARNIEKENKELQESICQWTTQDIGDRYIDQLAFEIYKTKDNYFYQYQTFTLDEKIRYGQGILDEIKKMETELNVLYNAGLISNEKHSYHLVELTKMYDDYYSRLIR